MWFVEVMSRQIERPPAREGSKRQARQTDSRQSDQGHPQESATKDTSE